MNIRSSVYTSVSKATSRSTIFPVTFSEWKCIYPFPCQRDRKDAEISFRTPESKGKTITNQDPAPIKAAYLIEISAPPHLRDPRRYSTGVRFTRDGLLEVGWRGQFIKGVIPPTPPACCEVRSASSSLRALFSCADSALECAPCFAMS